MVLISGYNISNRACLFVSIS